MPSKIKDKKIVALLLIILFLVCGIFLILKNNTPYKVNAYSSTPSSSPNLSCFVTDGTCAGAVIFRLSDYLDGHAETPSQSNHSYKVCCTGTGLSNSCAGSYDTVLKLSGDTDAHVEEKTLSNYSGNNVCLSSSSMGVTCGYSSSCSRLGSNYACLASISGESDAHAAECSVFPIKVCCKVSSDTPSPLSNPSISCSVTNGTCAGTTILGLSDYLDSHAEMPSSANYPYKVCCTGTGLSNSCAGSYDTVLKLSGDTDAHVEEKTLSNYSGNNVCLSSTTTGTVNCDYSSSCSLLGSNYTCLASISGESDAHIGDCSNFPTKVCCAIADPCVAKITSNKFISANNTDIQLCSGADITNPSDPCYSVCWKGAGVPDVSSSNWNCGICHNSGNIPIPCSESGGASFNWAMPDGYTTPADYTLVTGTLTDANPVVRFVNQETGRKIILSIVDNYGSTCSSSNTVQLVPKWREISPFK